MKMIFAWVLPIVFGGAAVAGPLSNSVYISSDRSGWFHIRRSDSATAQLVLLNWSATASHYVMLRPHPLPATTLPNSVRFMKGEKEIVFRISTSEPDAPQLTCWAVKPDNQHASPAITGEVALRIQQ